MTQNPTRRQLLNAWWTYEKARAAAETGGWTHDLSQAAAAAWAAYDKLAQASREGVQ